MPAGRTSSHHRVVVVSVLVVVVVLGLHGALLSTTTRSSSSSRSVVELETVNSSAAVAREEASPSPPPDEFTRRGEHVHDNIWRVIREHDLNGFHHHHHHHQKKTTMGNNSNNISIDDPKRVHVHVVGIGDSLVFGVYGPSEPRPFAPRTAEGIAARLRARMNSIVQRQAPTKRSLHHTCEEPWRHLFSKERAEKGLLVPHMVTWSYETHGFPGYHTKKILFGFRKLVRTSTATLIKYAEQQEERNKKGVEASAEEAQAVFVAAAQKEEPVPTAVDAERGEIHSNNVTEDYSMDDHYDDAALTEKRSKRTAGSAPRKSGRSVGVGSVLQTRDNETDKDLIELSTEYFMRRFAARTLDARELQLGLGGGGHVRRSKDVGSDTEEERASSSFIPLRSTDVLVVVCSVFTGINDSKLGIPYHWLRRNLQRLHDACRDYVAHTLQHLRKATSTPRISIVLSVPLRIIPPYYYLQEGVTAQTRRTAKRKLDPTGECEFWFRSPRRKINLHRSIDSTAQAALGSELHHVRLLESYAPHIISSNINNATTTTTPAAHAVSNHSHTIMSCLWKDVLGSSSSLTSSGRWCRRPTWCRGVPPIHADKASTNIERAVLSGNPCREYEVVQLGVNGTSPERPTTGKKDTSSICFLTRRVVPLDRLFVFPDKLVSTAAWRSQLALWSDCIHPSRLGYDVIANTLASVLSKDVERTLSLL